MGQLEDNLQGIGISADPVITSRYVCCILLCALAGRATPSPPLEVDPSSSAVNLDVVIYPQGVVYSLIEL